MVTTWSISTWLEELPAAENNGLYISENVKEDFRTKTGRTPPDWDELPRSELQRRNPAFRDVTSYDSETVVVTADSITRAIGQKFVPGRYKHEDDWTANWRNVIAALRAAGL